MPGLKLNKAGEYLTLGIQIAVNMVVPVMIGIYADRHFESSPIGLIIGSLVGFLALFSMILKIALKANAENESRKSAKK